MPEWETEASTKPMPDGFPDLDNVYAPTTQNRISRVLRRISDIGGTHLGFKHQNRPTVFKAPGSNIRKELCVCNEASTFTLPLRMARDEAEVEGCVVCDAADRWPRLKGH